jgi:pyrimidine operon attenuation protein/uracil phosphoribosyltransferase
VVLIDDVITTGATFEAAIDSIGPDRVRAVAAANAVSAVLGAAAAPSGDQDEIG